MSALTIGQLAGAAGVTPSTIRYYERCGLLRAPERTSSGYRIYAPDVVRRLTVIRNAQRFGFSLREIAAFLRSKDAGGRPCRRVRDAAEQMLASVDAQIAELSERRRQMQETLKRWDEKLAGTPPKQRAHLLESL